LPAALVVRAEGAQARDEHVRVAAPVRMMRPDEIPAAPLSLVHLPAFSGVAAIPASSA